MGNVDSTPSYGGDKYCGCGQKMPTLSPSAARQMMPGAHQICQKCRDRVQIEAAARFKRKYGDAPDAW